jgi:hypothetical protein
VQVWTYSAAQGWVQRGADIPVTFVNGDQFGVRVSASGQVRVYRNGTLLASRDISGWTYAASGGAIGLWIDQASNTLLDDFGGGNVTTIVSTATPTSTPLPNTATPTSTPLPNTATSTSTPTPLPNTATPTNTPLPNTATPTNTPLPNTATSTSTPLPNTATPTSTPLPDTATSTNTPTSLPNTATSTSTPLPNTATSTSTPLPNTATSTNTPTSLPNTATPTSTPTRTPTNTPTPPAGGAPPIVRSGSVAGGSISLSVAGKFQLDFTSATAWQPARWYDLATSSSQDLANKGASQTVYNLLNEPIEIRYSGTWYNIANAQSPTVTILEENASRVVLRTQFHLRPTSSDFLVQTDYTVYASGRVAVSASVQNQSGASRTLSSVEYAFLNVEDSLSWTVTALSSSHAIGFQRGNGATPLPNLLAINYAADTGINTDGTGNRYWLVGTQNLASNASFSRQWELQLTPGGQATASLTTRANDARAPALTIVSGGTAVGTGYDTTQAAYTIQASASSVSFYPTSAQQRHTPVFVVTNWSGANWQVSLNGTVLASSAQPQGSQAIASYDPANQRLVIQYLGTIPTTATTAQRTFVVSSN